MGSEPAYAEIFSWHPQDKEISRDKLARFLCGWLGGPHRYNEKYGKISLPNAHQHLEIHAAERDAWLECMRLAVEEQDFDDAFKTYLMKELSVPAERVRVVSEKLRAAQTPD